MSTQTYRPDDLYGRTVYASDGEKLGRVDDVLLETDGTPAYIETKKGLFSGRRHVLPVAGMSLADDDLTVAYTKAQIENAPPVNDDDVIDYERERELGAHYDARVRDWDDRRDALTGEDLSRGPTPQTRYPEGGLDDVRDTTEGPTPETRIANRAAKGTDAEAAGQPEADRATRGGAGTQDAGYRAAIPSTEDSAGSMIRSEEELTVGTHRQTAGRVRLRKYVETERAHETVALQHDEARVSRVPLGPGEGDEATIGERQVELELTEEVAEVDKRVVPKERVSLDVETVADEERVSDEVRKERVEVSGDVDHPTDRDEQRR
jgi:uncharacterized protein (TIGR02271 family)